jgi:hypothetical protein
MTEKHSPEDPGSDDNESEVDIQRRFQETLGRLVNTPHKPYRAATEKPQEPPR